MLFERTDADVPVHGPELESIIPGRGDEGVATQGVPIDGVYLAGMFLEGPYGVLRDGEVEVVELEGAVGDGGDEEGVVGLGPGGVVDGVGCVEGDGVGEEVGLEFEDVEAAVAEDSEVLGGSGEEAVLVERGELHGVAVEGSAEDWHALLIF